MSCVKTLQMMEKTNSYSENTDESRVIQLQSFKRTKLQRVEHLMGTFIIHGILINEE